MKTSFLLFVVLQAADLLTTLVVLRLGGMESNPLVRNFMNGDAFAGLLLAKALALGIGVMCVLGQKWRVIRVTNMAFSAVVAWNMTILARLL